MARRAAVLGWSRARVAIGRDIEDLLKHRGNLAEMTRSGGADVGTVGDANGDLKGAAALMGTTNRNTSAKSGASAGFHSVAAAARETKQTENSVDF
eukprot:CAMPEP_0172539028 /NCGR_PEP_ID=MMETSP1067-20121228/10315_1 /TAXON_ID=265564 ORGANISM="Thalassiosira punctigera, Strain Tpunct2005C2" /NCGR_SAMPLE_ID=MMETSP1067 /ASSEMBLY_ACC=CAM_ASM_000444 /LENGTH=95 /DNA_ID=CAMNT_0013324647 /DNA_START=126 /DNA_END=410 /DNA_ORIENTATION=+